MIVETTPLDERFSFAIDTDYRESLEDIFIKKEFLDLHSSHFGHYSKYQLVDKNRKESYGACHVTSKDGWHFRSPGRGAFGGALFHPAISFTLKERFYEAILENLRSRSAEKVEVVLPPEIYDLAHHAESVNILLRMGFAIKYSELNYAFLLRHYNGTPEFDSGNRKQLRKCLEQNLTFRVTEPFEYREAYHVIATNRAAKGYPLTLSYEALWEMAVKLPDRIACFGAFRGSEMVAASVCVKVRPDILYVFYWGELPTMKRISPTTFLAARMLDFAKQTGLEIMDLGISTEHSEPNLGLMKYKSHLGSFPSLKLVLEKTL